MQNIYWLLPFFLVVACQTGHMPGLAPSLVEKWVTVTSENAQRPESEADSLERSGFDPASVGYMVFDLKTKKTVRYQNAGKLFLPASVMKIPTVLYALEVLGTQYRFRTSLKASGRQVGDRWEGDLFLEGTGDPLFTVSELASLVQALQKKGIRSISGHFYYDASHLAQTERITQNQPDDAAYNCGVSALSLDFNRFRVKWRPGVEKGITEGFSIPEMASIRLGLGTSGKKNGENFFCETEPNAERWLLLKDTDLSGSAELPVHHPAKFTSLLFQKLARGLGMVLPAPEPGRVPLRAQTVRDIFSAPVLDLASRGLEYSNNLVIELLLLASARKQTGKALSISEAAQQARGWWVSHIPTVNWTGFFLENGSGLGTQSRISPQQLIAILQWGDNRSYEGRSLLSLLPVAGWKGSLRNRLEEPLTSLNVWAKTGTMNYGSALAGYLFSQRNAAYLFVLFVNDLERRKTEGHTPRNADTESWIDRSRDLQEDLLTQWVGDL